MTAARRRIDRLTSVVCLQVCYTRCNALAGKLPSLNGLKVFERVARHMSFTKAAAELNVTQTAVSHQIRRLEDELGIRLFHRFKERLELTASGQVYLQGVSLAFEQLRFSTEQLLEGSNKSTLTISTLATFASKWLLPRLGSFRLKHPDIDIRLSASTDLIHFVAGGADAAIRYGSGEWKGLRVDRLMDDEIFPVCSPKLLTGSHPLTSVDNLAHHTLLQVSGVTSNDWSIWLDAAKLPTNLRGGARLTFDLALMAVQAAVEGHGVCIGRRAYVEDDLRAGRLIAPFGKSVITDRAFYLVSPHDLANCAKVVALRTWLMGVIGDSRDEATVGLADFDDNVDAVGDDHIALS
ncbi:Glycine cleavage system transcriptional activator [Paraburkholderia graminis C4D1M]|uniref:Transcriptional regulator, LysR family n=2 Tax=Bacteria TaxID=2 RepID=B1FY51_PARG4|nr:transcriptional regulator, LysR family [Paraburkholderia graminis C4D1M]CAB3694738.1 Glycine cleavage system transcriptional activator [Paraburkholderia graminis C4D1M]